MPPWVTALQGITIPDVLVKVIEPLSDENAKTHCLARMADIPLCPRRADISGAGGRFLPPSDGSFLFTHFGVSGPAVLDRQPRNQRSQPAAKVELQCDFLPGVKQEELDAMIAAECTSAGQRQMAVILGSLAASPIGRCHFGASPSAAAIAAGPNFPSTERRRLIQAIKQWPIPVAGTMGFRKAEVTAGGVALDRSRFPHHAK